jgi:GNAT superfamily N-acetyltransferase
MHLHCEPRSLLPIAIGVEFVTVQDLLDDEPACRALWDLIGSQFRTRSKFLAIWPGVRHVALCRDPDRSVVGFLLVSAAVNWQFDYVVVRDDARGRGLASALVRTALNEACRRNVPTVMLSCDEALRPLYEGCGFQPVTAPAPPHA